MKEKIVEFPIRIDHLGYAIKDKQGRYYSSQHKRPVKSIKNCDTFPSKKDAKANMRRWNNRGESWEEVVLIGILEL